MIRRFFCVIGILIASMFIYAGYLLAVEADPGAFILGLFGIGLMVTPIAEWK